MSTTTEVTPEDLHDLLEIFGKKSFEASACEEGTKEEAIEKKCEHLFKQDYAIVELDNTNGVLSPRYPRRIFIPEYEHSHATSTKTPISNPTFSQMNNTTAPQDVSKSDDQTSSCSSSTTTITDSIDNSVSRNDVQTSSTSSSTTTNMDSTDSGVQSLSSSAKPEQLQQTSSVPSINSATSTIYEDLTDFAKVRETITLAKYARCRQRFVVPVIMYRGKYICRSATLSINAEIYGRKVVNYAYDYWSGGSSDRSNNIDDESTDNNEDSLMPQPLNEPLAFSYEEVIKSDTQLLRTLNVRTIVDLMVEQRKIKYYMAVSSSEKAHPDSHYQNFTLISLPYPGCEFFKQYRDYNYTAEGLQYDWTAPINDANLNVPALGPAAELKISWDEYKNWDLVVLTQNYLNACLKYIQKGKSGVLVHCISGWDRTPLFISLLRLTLWADGLIHQSLDALQMTYFTVAYDWYLFSHQLSDRLKRGEDIMFFCFNFLKFITELDFSIVEHRKRTKTSSSSGSSVIVLDESVKDSDPESNDSTSNSSCGMPMVENHYSDDATQVSSVSKPSTRASNPISVPNGGRQRNDSTSSASSWHLVTETGSIDSTANGSYMKAGCSGANKNATTNTTNGKEPLSFAQREILKMRRKRLNAVRSIFIRTYVKTVGLKFQESASTHLASLINTLTSDFF